MSWHSELKANQLKFRASMVTQITPSDISQHDLDSLTPKNKFVQLLTLRATSPHSKRIADDTIRRMAKSIPGISHTTAIATVIRDLKLHYNLMNLIVTPTFFVEQSDTEYVTSIEFEFEARLRDTNYFGKVIDKIRNGEFPNLVRLCCDHNINVEDMKKLARVFNDNLFPRLEELDISHIRTDFSTRGYDLGDPTAKLDALLEFLKSVEIGKMDNIKNLTLRNNFSLKEFDEERSLVIKTLVTKVKDGLLPGCVRLNISENRLGREVIDQFINAINEGKLPNIESLIFETVGVPLLFQEETRAALDKAIKNKPSQI